MPFGRFGLVLLAGTLVAAGAQAACNLELSATVPLKIENGRLFIPGAIGEHKVDYLVDLGAPDTLLQEAGHEFGITPDNFRRLPLKAVMGDAEKQATLGPDADHDVALAVERLPMRFTGTLPNFGSPLAMASLGMDFFAHYDVEFDVAHKTARLFVPTGCETARLAYWTKQYVVADMVPNITPPLNAAPYTAYNFPHIQIRVSVNGQEMLAAIDTGYKDSSLSLAAAHRAGVDVASAQESDAIPDVFDGYASRAWVGSFNEISFGAETVTPAWMKIHSFNPPAGSAPAVTGGLLAKTRNAGADMVLGADFLISHRVLVSYSQNKVYFSPAEDRTFLGAAPVLPTDVSSR